MRLFKEDLNKLPLLTVGFIMLSVGIMLIQRSELGLFAWGVFNEGLALHSVRTFGQIVRDVGFLILAFSMIAFKTKVGIGTFLNILIVGYLIDFSGELLTYIPDSLVMQIVLFTAGLLIMNVGRALYISTKLGAGPRDGLFVGLSRISKIDVKYIKPAIEITVLITGYLLGGIVGIGTFITMFASGYMVQYFFKVFKFDPKVDRQRSIGEYFTLKKDVVT